MVIKSITEKQVMQKRPDRQSHATLDSTEYNSKLAYCAPTLTILGKAAELTQGNETQQSCDAMGPGHGIDPCSP